jgi:hypothetical protein
VDDEAQARHDDEEAWEHFMEAELQELKLRKDGQLVRLLGEPLPGESSAARSGALRKGHAGQDRCQQVAGNMAQGAARRVA